MHLKTTLVALMATIATVAISCRQNSDLPQDIDQLGRANAEPLADQGANAAITAPVMGNAASKVHRGVAAEVVNVPNYTYVRLTTDAGSELWAAIPTSTIQVGQPIEIIESMLMKDFHSKTLDRTFASIVFGIVPGMGSEVAHPGVHPTVGSPQAPAGMAMPPGHPSAQEGNPAPAPASGSES